MFKKYPGKFSLFGLSFLILAAILAFITATIVTSPSGKQDLRSKAAPSTQLYFYPQTLSVISSLPRDQSVNIMINPAGNSVTAAEIHLSFDPTKINIKNIVPSSLFPNILTIPVIDNQLGKANFTVGVPAASSGSSAVSEIASIASVYFTYTKAGSSTINFTSDTQAAGLNETGNVITTLTPLSILVQTPTPTFTPTPSPTLSPTPSPTPIPVVANLNITMTLQKINSKKTDIPVAITFYDPAGNIILSQTPNFTGDNNGIYNYNLTGLILGTFTIKIKPRFYLTRKTSLSLANGEQSINLIQAPFLSGDISENNKIDIFDYNRLVEDFGPNMPTAGSPADFDKNNKVDIYDYNLLVENFTKTGDN
ncbi:hypothetical protein HY030_00020 [Candidatus Gottesmanbacteria bacterium]|nr:hypothetical protein [Candidatus Gottesmanbacteria bacterium]